MFFPKADAAALGIMYFTVFDDPSLTPVRANQPRLKRSRRSPLGSGSAHRKAGYRDKINSFFLRKKAIRPHTDLRTAIVWILSAKIAIEYRFLLFDNREPAEHPFRCSDIFRKRRKRSCLIHRCAVQKHLARMMRLSQSIIPVAKYFVCIGVIFAKQRIVYLGTPYAALERRPASDNFCAADNGMFSLCIDIDNALVIAESAVFRIDPFTISTAADDNRVARHGNIRSLPDCTKRIFSAPVAQPGIFL